MAGFVEVYRSTLNVSSFYPQLVVIQIPMSVFKVLMTVMIMPSVLILWEALCVTVELVIREMAGYVKV